MELQISNAETQRRNAKKKCKADGSTIYLWEGALLGKDALLGKVALLGKDALLGKAARKKHDEKV